MDFTLTSSFKTGQDIPREYTADGRNASPPLLWGRVPVGTQSLALIVDDPDAPDPKAPQRVWVHWVLYNLPADSKELPEAVASSHLPKGTREGTNDWGKTGYGGPKPPIGKHRYYFKLYALDAVLADLGHPGKAELEAAMEGHILGKAELMGLYQKA